MSWLDLNADLGEGTGDDAAMLEISARACKELGVEEATVPAGFPVELADRLRADGVVLDVDRALAKLDAIADGIVSTLRDERIKPIGREGVPASHWVLLDYGSVIVHIFTPPERDYYGLEKHWSEAKTILRVQ